MQTTSTPESPKEILRGIRVLFYGLVIGAILFGGIAYALNKIQGPAIKDATIERIFLIMAVVLAGICLIFSNLIYKKKINPAFQFNMPLVRKLNYYRAALIIFLSFCEGATLFALVVFFLSGNCLLLAIAGIMVLSMLIKRPEKSRIFNELHLDSREQLELS